MKKLENLSEYRITHFLGFDGNFKSSASCIFRADCNYFIIRKPIYILGNPQLLIYEERPEHLNGGGVYLAVKISEL